MSAVDCSFEAAAGTDLAQEIITNQNEGDENIGEASKFPIKKLSEVFDACLAAKTADDTSMKVYLRVRPSSAGKGTSTIEVESDTSIVTSAPESSKRAQYTKLERRHYAFTRVFGPDSSQGDVFLNAAHPLFERFVNGDSSVLFAYGMTNAGKTYTIQGSKVTPGIMPLLVQEVLGYMHLCGDTEWDLNVSMLEIYQEKIYDLLSEKKKREKLSIRDGNGRVEVMGLSQHPISSAEQAIDLMDSAMARRSNSKTHLNNGSSRSHAVYSLTLSRYSGGRETKSEFQVVDLAGAERSKRTQGTSSQQKEANIINMSLMQLWRCLQAMGRRGHAASDIVPFRESKLTHLLMPLLGRVGLVGVAMMTCVNPQNDDYDETVSILGNASLACKIQEIADLGRTVTVGVVGALSQVGNPLDNIRSHKYRSSSTSSAGSNQGASVGAAMGKKKGGSLSSNNGGAVGGERHSSLLSVSEGDGGATSSALKKLKEEISLMQAQNEHLLRAQAVREQEIRAEVAEEMASRSSHLLEQLQALQDQVNTTTDSYHMDVTKSVMKAKKKQIQAVNDEISAELQGYMHEMEVELLTVRETYDEEIETLKKEKEELEVALHNWKGKAEEAIAIAERLNDEKEELQYMLSTQMQHAHQSASVVNNSTNVFSAITEAAAHLDKNLGVFVKPKSVAPPAPGFLPSSSSARNVFEEDGNKEWFEQSASRSQFQSNNVYGNDDFDENGHDDTDDDDDDGDDADTVTLKRDNRERDSEIRSVNGEDDSDGDAPMEDRQGSEEEGNDSPPDYEESLKEPTQPPPPPPHVQETVSSKAPAAAVATLASELMAKNVAEKIQLYIPPTRLSRTLMRGSGSSVNGSALSINSASVKGDDVASTATAQAAGAASAEDASHSTESLSQGSSVANAVSANANSAASAFEMRMKRDQRFQKSEPPQQQQAPPATATATAMRSPLAPAQLNSPKVSLENSEKLDNAEKRPVLKRALSPMRTAGAGAKVTIHADSKENLASSSSRFPASSSQSQALNAAKSPARAASTKRVRSEENTATTSAAAPVVKMTAKARAQAADQKAKAKVSEVLTESGGIPPLNRRLLRAGGRVV